MRRGLSLELKLPLAVSALLTSLLLLYVWIAYRDVAQSETVAANERAARLAVDLASISSGATIQRAAFVSRMSNRPEVAAALAGGPVPPADTILRELRMAPDSNLAIVLVDPARRPIHFLGGRPAPEIARRLEPVLQQAELQDTLAVNGPLFVHGRHAYFWSATQVRNGRQHIGYVAQLRRIGAQSPTSRTLNRLIGEHSTIIISNTHEPDGPWVTLEGEVLTPPTDARVVRDVVTYHRGDEWYIAGSDTINGSQFSIAIEIPRSATVARANQFLRRTGLVGLLLLLAGTLVIWLLSRRFTQPIRALNQATTAVGAGNYDHRVDVKRTDELGALGKGFNHMAGEIKMSMQAAQASRAEAELANRVKSEFLANMSHEIRTPINAMLGYTDLMEMGVDGPLTEAQRTHLERVRLSGQHLVSLIDDLLDFTRLDSAGITVQQRIASASEAIRTALTVIDPEARAKPVELSWNVEPDTQYLGDPKRVEQILVNLLGNAVKFTPAGGSVRIDCRKVSANGQGALAEFAVEDTGVGIAPDRLQTIFEPFVQVQGGYTRQHGGSGLGLTISSRLAELMGGRITVESQVGKGSRFVLTLPAPGDGRSA